MLKILYQLLNKKGNQNYRAERAHTEHLVQDTLRQLRNLLKAHRDLLTGSIETRPPGH